MRSVAARHAIPPIRSRHPDGVAREPVIRFLPFHRSPCRASISCRGTRSRTRPRTDAQANTTHSPSCRVGGGRSHRGRPRGRLWAHQSFPPPPSAGRSRRKGPRQQCLQSVASNRNPVSTRAAFHPALHPELPDQGPLTLGLQRTLPPKVMIGPNGEPTHIAPPQYSSRPTSRTAASQTHDHDPQHNGTTGRRTTASPVRSSPPQFYDYHYPSSWRDATPSTPSHGSEGRIAQRQAAASQARRLARTMSTHMVHDHMSASPHRTCTRAWPEFNIYSALDRATGDQRRRNLRLPSGNGEGLRESRLRRNLARGQSVDANGQLKWTVFNSTASRDIMTVKSRLQAVLSRRAAQVPLPHPEASVSRFFKSAPPTDRR